MKGFRWAQPKVLPCFSFSFSFSTLSIRSSFHLSLPTLATRSSSPLPINCQLSKPRTNPIAQWVSKNDAAARNLPIFVGAASLLSVLVNRAVSGIPPVSDASSSQSRADLLTLGLAVTNILAGLVWLTIKPKPVVVVVNVSPRLNNLAINFSILRSFLTALISPSSIPSFLIRLPLNSSGSLSYLLPPPRFIFLFISRVWESLRSATCTRSLIIVSGNTCIFQYGVASIEVDAEAFVNGSLYLNTIKSGIQLYLANLSLYPGRSQLPFLPPNTQSVILQPIGESGMAVIGGDVIRGYTSSDQGWISLVAEKMDSALSKHNRLFNKIKE